MYSVLSNLRCFLFVELSVLEILARFLHEQKLDCDYKLIEKWIVQTTASLVQLLNILSRKGF